MAELELGLSLYLGPIFSSSGICELAGIVVGFGSGVEELRSSREGSGILSKEKHVGTCVSTFSLCEREWE